MERVQVSSALGKALALGFGEAPGLFPGKAIRPFVVAHFLQVSQTLQKYTVPLGHLLL